MPEEHIFNFIKSRSPDAFLEIDKQKKGFVCPVCNNGTGQTGDGIRKMPHSEFYKCFKCGFCGDIFDLIGIKFGLEEFEDVYEKAEKNNIDVNMYQFKNTFHGVGTLGTGSPETKRLLEENAEYIKKLISSLS